MDENEKKELERAKRRERKKEMREQIQTLYGQMMTNQENRNDQWNECIGLIEAYAKTPVWAYLRRTPYADSESFQQIMQNGRIELWENNVLESYKKSLEKNPSGKLADYAKGAYLNIAKDYVMAGYNYKKKFVSTSKKEEEDGSENLKVEREDYKAYLNRSYDAEMRELSEGLVGRYMQMVMNSEEEPFQIIFLCYSKILPVVLRETNCFSADGWAWKAMQDKSMFELSDRFVMVFNSAVQMIQVTFGQPYKDNLELPYEAYAKKGFVVLTEAFEQKNTKNWVARLNKKIMIDLVSAVMQEANTDEAVRRLVAESRIYTEFIKRAKRK